MDNFPESIKKLKESGWTFQYSKHTSLIQANHPKGGKFSVCEMKCLYNEIFDDFGKCITFFLNS